MCFDSAHIEYLIEHPRECIVARAMNYFSQVDPILTGVQFRCPILPEFLISGPITQETAARLSNAINQANNSGQPVLPIVIDSNGGDVLALMAMKSSIQHSQVKIATIVTGRAMSAAAILFAYGTPGLRYIGEEATVMIHDVSTMAEGKLEELKARVENAELLNNKIFRDLATRSGHSDPEYFLKIIKEKNRADWTLQPQEVIMNKIADHLGVPEFSVYVGATIRFGILGGGGDGDIVRTPPNAWASRGLVCENPDGDEIGVNFGPAGPMGVITMGKETKRRVPPEPTFVPTRPFYSKTRTQLDWLPNLRPSGAAAKPGGDWREVAHEDDAPDFEELFRQ